MSTHEVMEMLAEAFAEPVESLSPARQRSTIPGWDSMGALMVIAEMDERFGIELSADASRKMIRIGDVLDFLRQHNVLSD
jgi:acyl carrier protein